MNKNAKKGHQGFISKPIEEIKTTRVSVYLTNIEAKKWKEYLAKNDILSTEELRAYILSVI